MIIKFKCTLLALLFSALLASAQTPGSLKANYTFSGNALDMSGQNNNGQIIGNVLSATDRVGQNNCAYSFPGDSGSYIEVPLSTDFVFAPAQSFTISLWYQGGSPGAGDREAFWSEHANFSNYFFGLYDVNRVLFHQCWAPMSSTVFPAPDTSWHHAVAIYDNGDFKLYRDNQLLTFQPASSTTPLPAPANNIVIGRGFLGKIDDVRYYNEALDSNAIATLFSMPGSCQAASIADVRGSMVVDLYPNPVSDFIRVDLKQQVQTLKMSLYSVHGRLIKTLAFEKTETAKIDLHDVPDGCYLLNISDGSNSRSRIIQKVK